MQWNKIYKIVLSLGIAIGAVVRVANIWLYSPLSNLFSDPERHWLYTQRIPEKYLFSAIDPIGYQVWLRFITQFTLNDNILFNIYTSILSLFTAFIWYKVLSELSPKNKLTNLIGFLVFMWLPSWIEIFSYTMTETLFLPLLGMCLYITFKIKEKNTITNWNLFAISLLWALCCLTRLVALPIAMICLLYLVYREKKNIINKSNLSNFIANLKWKQITIIISTFAIILGVVGYRNYLIIKTFSPFGYGAMNQVYTLSGNETINVNIYNKGVNTENWWFGSPSMNTKPLEPLSDWKSERKGEVSIFPDISDGSVGWEQYLIDHKVTTNYTQILKENFLFFFFGESWPDSNRLHPMSMVSYQMRWFWFPLFILISILNILYISMNKKIGIIQIIVTICTILIIFNYSAVMEGRYRKPFEGLWLLNLFWLLPRINKLPRRKSTSYS